ncbi:hypothetical protein [Paraburkholderia xenovorans]|uniref:hypothetical protein n=1 Tax=Paraburkholderia xenovorans TaxID=36873 RepID=UPI0015C52A27|nr:hypothetical protein [Paraburkholderia xenovorans]NPT39720.1 hypothetical protein [Paraburkholderia xenovorans]
MKPTPLLDFWQKPANAGEPVALLATTFALEPDFFEQNCLARFLEVSSVNEGAGSVDDIVASVELHELLQNASVSVLADRSAPVQRTSLFWDLLTCKVEGVRSAEKSGRQHSVELRNGGIDEPNPQSRVHEGIS